MSLDLSESFEKSFDESIYEILDQISPFIDQTNSEAIDLFSQLHVSPNSPDSQEKLNKLFSLISEKNGFEQVNARIEKNAIFDNILISLLSQSLSIFKTLLKSKINEIDLNNFQKQILSLHSKRIENYFSTYPIQSETFNNFIQKNSNIPLQIQELNTIQAKSKNEKNPKILHFYIDILFHISETILIFNDFIITENQHQSILNDSSAENSIINELESILYDNNKPNENFNQKSDLKSLLKMLKTKVSNINDENKQMKDAISELTTNKINENKQMKNSISELTTNKINENSDQINKKEILFLKEQISILQDQLSVSQHISDEKSQTIDELTNKIKSLELINNELTNDKSSINTIKGLHSIIEESANQLELCKKAKFQSLELFEKSKKEIQRLSIENDELKAMLQRSSREAQKQIIDNATLLKQLRRQKNDSSDEIVEELKEQLKMAQYFIRRLQNEIESCRNEIMIDYDSKRQSPYSFDSIDPIIDDFDRSLNELDETICKSKKANSDFS